MMKDLFKKDDLSKNEIIKRTIIIIVLLALAVGAISYGVSALTSKNDGWYRIGSDAKEIYGADEFVVNFCLGNAGVSATREHKQLTAIYTEQIERLYKLFTVEEEHGTNMAYINAHPNETLKVDATLYGAFDSLKDTDVLYLAPIYEYYRGIFSCHADNETADFDPNQNAEVKADVEKILAFIKAGDVKLEILGDGNVRLYVSDEYLAYAEENYVKSFIDFNWTKNAFICDALADAFASAGFTMGSVSSYDGFTRNLDKSGAEYGLNIFDRKDGKNIIAAQLEYSGATAFVTVRAFPMLEADWYHYYTFADGRIYTAYISAEDGMSKCAVSSLTGFEKGGSCAKVLADLIPAFIGDEVGEIPTDAVYCKDGNIYTNADVTLKNLYDGYQIERQ